MKKLVTLALTGFLSFGGCSSENYKEGNLVGPSSNVGKVSPIEKYESPIKTDSSLIIKIPIKDIDSLRNVYERSVSTFTRDSIPYDISRANGFFEDTPDVAFNSDVEKRLEEVRNHYTDLAIEPVFGEIPHPKEVDNSIKVVIGFNVYPVLYGAGNSYMGDSIKYIATGEGKPFNSDFFILREPEKSRDMDITEKKILKRHKRN